MTYGKTELENGKWVIVEKGRDYKAPLKRCATFAFDTETLVYLDGKIETQKAIFEKLKDVALDEKRQRLFNEVWAWQVYDEYNGFFMTNDFEQFLTYICRAGYDYGWCYNSTFDFAQVDYEILAKGAEKWKPHIHEKGKAYNKRQPYTYESVHNDAGARYAYKLWFPYNQVSDRHTYVHSVEFRDFMKLCAGGLKKLLKDLDVKDAEGQPIRKLEMDYQAVDANNLTQDEIAYCCNDVKGLYFAVKQFNETMEQQSDCELHIYGKETNIMTAGGFAKRELLRSMYPDKKDNRARLRKYQREHPLSPAQDKWLRDNHLYRGGISFVNPKYKGRLLTAEKMKSPMYRYDVNSEYPYAMASIRDLVGKPVKMTIKEWESLSNKDDYEAIYLLKSVYGELKPHMLGIWYDPFRRDFVETINEDGLHLMFERELREYENWYDLEIEIEYVLACPRGDYAYKRFVDENYELKAQAKKDGNKTIQQCTKLKLNSSYGKLAERLERRKGHYELNKETGAVHFVDEGIEQDASCAMSVLVGSLVTSYARCYILSKIREVTNGNPSQYFVYIDTDSIHAFSPYDKADAYALGGLKLEATCSAVKYIAPKTYIDIEEIGEDGNIDLSKIEIHTKGISLSAIMEEFKAEESITLDYLDDKISYGAKYVVLQAMNVRGGKVLVPTEKYLARWELAPQGLFFNAGYEGNYINER